MAVAIDPSLVQSNSVSLTVAPPPGRAPFATNISGGPYVVAVGGGAVRAVRTPTGFTVARRRRPGAARIVVKLSTGGGALTAGRWISVTALGILGILACYAVAAHLRRQ